METIKFQNWGRLDQKGRRAIIEYCRLPYTQLRRCLVFDRLLEGIGRGWLIRFRGGLSLRRFDMHNQSFILMNKAEEFWDGITIAVDCLCSPAQNVVCFQILEIFACEMSHGKNLAFETGMKEDRENFLWIGVCQIQNGNSVQVRYHSRLWRLKLWPSTRKVCFIASTHAKSRWPFYSLIMVLRK